MNPTVISANPFAIISRLHACGIRLRVVGADLKVSPKDRLTPELREVLIAHKAEVIAALNPITTQWVDLVRIEVINNVDCVHIDHQHNHDFYRPEDADQIRLIRGTTQRFLQVTVTYENNHRRDHHFPSEEDAACFINGLTRCRCGSIRRGGPEQSNDGEWDVDCEPCVEERDPHQWLTQTKDPTKPKNKWHDPRKDLHTLEEVADKLRNMAEREAKRDDRLVRIVSDRTGVILNVVYDLNPVARLSDPAEWPRHAGEWLMEEYENVNAGRFTLKGHMKKKKMSWVPKVESPADYALSVDAETMTLTVSMEPYSGSTFTRAFEVATEAVKRKLIQNQDDYRYNPSDAPEIRIREPGGIHSVDEPEVGPPLLKPHDNIIMGHSLGIQLPREEEDA